MRNESKFLHHTPCPSCNSKNNNALYDDGHTYCFGCETWRGSDRQIVPGKKETPLSKEVESYLEGTVVGSLNDRGITKDTMKKYGVRLSVSNNIPTKHHYPYTNSHGDIVAWKVRGVPKTFHVEGDINAAGLFGQDVFPAGGKKLTLCEGELDALASFQIRGSKWPTVSIPQGAPSAYKYCKKNFEYLNSFEEIFIDFDNDEQGQKAAKEVASLFPKKARIKRGVLKDACEYLRQGKEQLYTQEWWDAKEYKPDDILFGEALWDIVNTKDNVSFFQYPWSGLNYMTYGGRAGEMVTVLAGTGVGKTTFLREITHGVFNTTTESLGLIYLEETKKETTLGPMSMQLSRPMHLPDAIYTPAEKRQAFDETWGTKRLYTLSDSWSDNSLEYIVDKITYLVKGCDCKYIVLDHISFLVSDQHGDERKMLDEIAHKLKAATVELNIHLCIIAHARRTAGKPLEEGGKVSLSDIRGTAGIGQLSNIVMGLERDGQNEDSILKNTTRVRVVKNRFSGRTGLACNLLYDETSGRMTEVEAKEADDD